MKTTVYIQLAPKHNRAGQMVGVTAKTMSHAYPGQPRVGALVLKLNLEVPDDAFRPTIVNVQVPMEKLVSQVTGTVQ